MPIEWEEEPFEWDYPHIFSVKRIYSRGPVAQMSVRVLLEPLPEGGTRLVYEVWAVPRNWLGFAAIPLQVGWLSARQFKTVLQKYDRLAQNPETTHNLGETAHLAQGGSLRLEAIRRELVSGEYEPGLVDELARLVEKGDELKLAEMRPYALADLWKKPRRTVLELFLHATRLGLLEFRWETLCPHCRKSPLSHHSLREVEAHQHCPSCKIDYTVSFDQTVELVFRPSPTIRPIPESQKFCIAGPRTTPHIVSQQLLQPGERCTLQPGLSTGHYRLRVLEQAGIQMVRVGPDGKDEAAFRFTSSGWEAQAEALSTSCRLELENATPGEHLFILERSDWNAQATPAVDVVTLQTFRDLFAAEALRPGEPISVGSLTIVFTDLRGSTRLYREIGDAPAFGSVMGHFDVLKEVIAAAGGSIVKTMGDAVMAVFQRPADALLSMYTAQQRLAAPSAGNRPFLLKAAIHQGPVIAIQANDRLDYFGSIVNQAARMVDLSIGEDIILSESVNADPETAALLDANQLQAECFEVLLKGFDQETFRLWRVKRKPAPA